MIRGQHASKGLGVIGALEFARVQPAGLITFMGVHLHTLEVGISEKGLKLTEKVPIRVLPEDTQKIVPIREVYDGPVLPFSYTLRLDQTIIDRKSNQELHSVIGEKGKDVARKLLAVHPSGGRLRVTESGLVLGYEEERWVVIGAISASEWFAIK